MSKGSPASVDRWCCSYYDLLIALPAFDDGQHYNDDASDGFGSPTNALAWCGDRVNYNVEYLSISCYRREYGWRLMLPATAQVATNLALTMTLVALVTCVFIS
ncbi:hypothetical protein DEO72_LG10g2370 [Vigna unguiculata]|uniref:Uncharacterized protein n=1 Tax=Vigna unguiculata TaxID=3917 RepID=A0A4D6NGS7_VIGUN|nr:hypothetical protein DEO72_LG10g2370 [Vigna unguiculata]